MNIIELKTPIQIHNRIVNSFYAEQQVLQTIGAKDITQARDWFMAKLREAKLAKPMDQSGTEIEPPNFKHNQDFFYDLEVELP